MCKAENTTLLPLLHVHSPPLSPLPDTLSPTAFAPVKADINGNIEVSVPAFLTILIYATVWWVQILWCYDRYNVARQVVLDIGPSLSQLQALCMALCV